MSVILLPTDFSSNAISAADYAFKMFSASEWEFVLLNCYDLPHLGSNTMLVSLNDILKKDSEEGMQKEVDRLKTGLGKDKSIRGICRQGAVFDAVKKLEPTIKPEFVVMGIKGASPAEEVLIGSNTTAVISAFSTPVLAIPDNYEFGPPKNIVFATDLTSEAEVSQLGRLAAFAKDWDSTVTLLNVQKKGHRLDALEEYHVNRLDKIFEGVDKKYHFIEDSDVIKGITKYIDENEVDLIAMVNRQLRYLSRLFSRSMSKAIAKHSSIPILVMRETT